MQLVDPKPISKVELKAFTAGLSKIRKEFEPHKDFKELSNVENELQQIATLWSVVDETTATIMSEFYTQLEEVKKTDQNKAEALRRSQLNIIEKYEQYRHPHFWAPFILVGNWQ